MKADAIRLVKALRLSHPEWAPVRLALVGAGGKTSLLFNLSRELLSHQLANSILVTTTTHLATHQALLADHHFIVKNDDDLERIFQPLPNGVILFTGSFTNDNRIEGPGEEVLESLTRLADHFHLPVLVEADGARQRPVKAPGAHEPVIPVWANYVIVLASLEALGKPVSDQWVHRPERFAELVSQSLGALSPGEMITNGMLGAVLTHPLGGLKGIPEKARRVVLLNGASTPALAAQARSMKSGLLEKYEAVLVVNFAQTVLAVYERVAGVILAAGGSSRFRETVDQVGTVDPDETVVSFETVVSGETALPQNKQLLPWQGKPLIRHVCKAAADAALDQVIVVTGSGASEVHQALSGFNLQFVHNPSWEEGQSTSLVRGLQMVNHGTGAVIFFLADQPQVPATLVQSLVELHTQTLSPLVAPQVSGRRANPVLFDRSTFPELLALKGDTGGRALFARHPVTWLAWLDENILLDVDTLGDYERLIDSHQSGSHPTPVRLAAVVLAAGLSRRMGRPKMLLPWGKTTVIQHVVNILEEAGLSDIYVVTGSNQDKIEKELSSSPAKLIFNAKFAKEEMLVSLQTGLTCIPEQVDAVLVVLGDQPQIEVTVVKQIVQEYQNTGYSLIVPSYQMHRGHPWLVHRSLWHEILSLQPYQTLRHFLAQKTDLIHYLVVEQPSILRDLDTIEDWEQEHP